MSAGPQEVTVKASDRAFYTHHCQGLAEGLTQVEISGTTYPYRDERSPEHP